MCFTYTLTYAVAYSVTYALISSGAYGTYAWTLKLDCYSPTGARCTTYALAYSAGYGITFLFAPPAPTVPSTPNAFDAGSILFMLKLTS